MKRYQRQKTYMAKTEDHKVQWFVLDAEGKTLGRLASEIAKILRGKHKPTFTPHADTGDGVVVINAEKIVVTGYKEARKSYYRYTGHPGGLRVTPYRVMLQRKPTFIIESAVKGMVPRTRLGRAQMRRLRVFAGDQHPHQAQTPTLVNC